MTEVTRSRDLLADPDGHGPDIGAKAGAIRLITAGSSAMPVPEARPFEGTIGAVGALYDLPFFDGELMTPVSFRGESEAFGNLGIPFYIESKEVPGYRVLEGDQITSVVSAPRDAVIWGQASGPHVTVREYFGPAGRSTRTITSLVKLPFSSRPQPSGRQALEDLSQSTGLSHAALGDLIGASRRSIYNWLRGRVMSPQFETRAVRLRATIRPLAERRAPGEIARWLQTGQTPPAELLREERWEDAGALVQQELEPRVLERMRAEPEEGEPETYSAETRRAVLAALRTPPPVEQQRRPDWRPREVTGTTTVAEDEAE